MNRMDNDALRRTLAERISEQWAGTFGAGAVNEWHVADVALAALGLDDLDAFAFRVWRDMPSEFDRADVEGAIKAALTASDAKGSSDDR